MTTSLGARLSRRQSDRGVAFRSSYASSHALSQRREFRRSMVVNNRSSCRIFWFSSKMAKLRNTRDCLWWKHDRWSRIHYLSKKPRFPVLAVRVAWLGLLIRWRMQSWTFFFGKTMFPQVVHYLVLSTVVGLQTECEGTVGDLYRLKTP